LYSIVVEAFLSSYNTVISNSILIGLKIESFCKSMQVGQTMSSYKPGTIFRAYNADKSTHNTALLLKDGRVLELKNADGSHKKTYDSYESWCVEKAIDATIETDTSKAAGVVIGKDTHGFNVCLDDNESWFPWCYRMMCESAPQLLENDAVKDAFNSLVAICEKHSEFRSGKWVHKTEYYNQGNLCYYDYMPIKGMIGQFRTEFMPNDPSGWTKEMYATARKEIGEAYKKLYDLIAPDVKPYMEKQYTLIQKKNKLKLEKKLVRCYERKAHELNWKEECLTRSYVYKLEQLKKDKERVAKYIEEHNTIIATTLERIKSLSSGS
jgi:hypothetical protein